MKKVEFSSAIEKFGKFSSALTRSNQMTQEAVRTSHTYVLEIDLAASTSRGEQVARKREGMHGVSQPPSY
jgi:hypothetical protein